jgi:hypothetical protein
MSGRWRENQFNCSATVLAHRTQFEICVIHESQVVAKTFSITSFQNHMVNKTFSNHVVTPYWIASNQILHLLHIAHCQIYDNVIRPFWVQEKTGKQESGPEITSTAGH